MPRTIFLLVLSFALCGLTCTARAQNPEISGITGITKGKADLTVPPNTPPGKVWRYGGGPIFQVGPRTAGFINGIQEDGTGNIDFGVGMDAILFDDLSKIGDAKPIPISRYEKGVHRDFGKTTTVIGIIVGGFVPFGAKQADGLPYPNAGTGFGIGYVILYAVDERGGFDYRETKKHSFQLFQFSYDGKDFLILGKEDVERNDLLPNSDWVFGGYSLNSAIPDGQDFLFAMSAGKKSDDHDDRAVAGVTRWRHGAKGWRPISFTPVTRRNEIWSEPSLIRDMDGSLLMSARSDGSLGSRVAFDVAVWRSTDNGKSWKQVIYRRKCRSESPVSINQAADGTPFVAANLPPLMRRRDILCYWPLNDSRTDLGELRIARDLRGEFGPAPSGSWWRADHPTSAIVRLADGAWHGILVYRIVDNGEIEGSAKPAPQTGCYVEEVHSRGPATEVWKF